MAQKRPTIDDGLRQARAALRLHRAVLSEDAVGLLAREAVDRLAGQMRPDAPASPLVPVEVFCAALLSDNPDAATDLIRREQRDGVPLADVYLVTLTEACRHLGRMWEEDRLSFLQMSLAAGRVFAILRHLRRQIDLPYGPAAPGHEALFATVPGEEHSIGVTLAADLFRSRGWEVELVTGLDHDALLARIGARRSRIIGLSASHPAMLVPLARLVVALRILRPEARIVVCGHVVAEVPDLNALIRADAVLHDDEDMVALFDRLVSES